MKGTLVFLLVLFTALILIGCTAPPTEVEEQLKITGFEQDVFCGSKSFTVSDGEKCGPPPCDSCCPNCPDCDSCCPDCPEPEECPTPTPCCCNLKWGDLYIYFNECCQEVCVTITFEDLTTIEECFCIDGNGEVKIILPEPVQQVIFVELI